jgi:hypothetical protein
LHAIEFLPPETLRTGTLTRSTDLYGLGALLHYALVGRTPHPGRLGEQPGERVLRILGKPVPAINAPDVPVAMATLVARLLAADPVHRPDDASQVAAQLAGLLPDAPPRPAVDFDDFAGAPPAPPPPAPQPNPAPRDELDDFAVPHPPPAAPSPEPVTRETRLWDALARQEMTRRQPAQQPASTPRDAPPREVLAWEEPVRDAHGWDGPLQHEQTREMPARQVEQAPTQETGLREVSGWAGPFRAMPVAPPAPPGRRLDGPETPAPEAPAREDPGTDEPQPADESWPRDVPAQAEPAHREPARAEPARRELAHAKPARRELAHAKPAHGEPAHAEPTRAEPTRAKPVQAEAGWDEPFWEMPDAADESPGPRASEHPAARQELVRDEPAGADGRRTTRSWRVWAGVGGGMLAGALSVVLVLLIGAEPDELASSPREPGDGGVVVGDVRVELSPPVDRNDRVELTWNSTRELDFAVVVAAEGKKTQVHLAHRKKAMTVDVEPGLKYCFMIQGTDSDRVYESQSVPLRGATCRK